MNPSVCHLSVSPFGLVCTIPLTFEFGPHPNFGVKVVVRGPRLVIMSRTKLYRSGTRYSDKKENRRHSSPGKRLGSDGGDNPLLQGNYVLGPEDRPIIPAASCSRACVVHV